MLFTKTPYNEITNTNDNISMNNQFISNGEKTARLVVDRPCKRIAI